MFVAGKKKELMILMSSVSATPRSVSAVSKAGGIVVVESSARIIMPFGSEPSADVAAGKIYPVYTTQEALQAIARNVPAIAIREAAWNV